MHRPSLQRWRLPLATIMHRDPSDSPLTRPRVSLLGEVALRVNDLAKMRAFYRDVVGLDVWRDGEDFVFLRVAEGVEGHPQALVLFDRKVEVGAARSTLDHLAFVIDLDDYEGRRGQLEQHGLEVIAKEFPFFGWRSLFVRDPEGNSVEFVCYDPTSRGQAQAD
jgi:catechol-2,3-dioxygenase